MHRHAAIHLRHDVVALSYQLLLRFAQPCFGSALSMALLGKYVLIGQSAVPHVVRCRPQLLETIGLLQSTAQPHGTQTPRTCKGGSLVCISSCRLELQQLLPDAILNLLLRETIVRAHCCCSMRKTRAKCIGWLSGTSRVVNADGLISEECRAPYKIVR